MSIGLGEVIGAVIAILLTIAVEYLRRPRLNIELLPARDNHYTDRPATRARFLDVRVVNGPLPTFARWMTRNAAIRCHGSISFHHLDGQNVFGRSMPIRWGSTPEPIAIRGELDGQRLLLFDPDRLRLTSHVDIPPGEGEGANVVVRFDTDVEAYGWSNESYFSDPPWRNPRWVLPSNRFLLRVSVRASGERCEALFRLVNDVPIDACRMEPAIGIDQVRD